MANSNPPNPKIKNVSEVVVMSSNCAPITTDRLYKTNQVNSAYNISVTKFDTLNTNPPIANQNKHNKKSTQPNTYNL